MVFSDTADVVPDQDWSEDGTARVTPKPPFPDRNARTLPLKHLVVEGGITVYRAEYPSGLVIIPQDSQVSGSSAILPLASSSGDSIILGDPKYQEWPDGIVVWFTS